MEVSDVGAKVVALAAVEALGASAGKETLHRSRSTWGWAARLGWEEQNVARVGYEGGNGWQGGRIVELVGLGDWGVREKREGW